MPLNLTRAVKAAMSVPAEARSMEHVVADIVATVAPIIEQQVRRQIADELGNKAHNAGGMAASFMNGGESYAAAASAYSDAAKIARGGK